MHLRRYLLGQPGPVRFGDSFRFTLRLGANFSRLDLSAVHRFTGSVIGANDLFDLWFHVSIMY
ncbi:MAG: hypothetical protein U5R30_20715 [Deltaproteobacteria bacterium]|nr:hypothetical protein [Deltaproteobacteria bacterium]